jgi:hypothetical protein
MADMTGLKVGQEVRIFDINRRGQPGGRPGKVMRVGRTLFDVITDIPGPGIMTFRLDTGHSNDAYGHQFVKTLEQVALDDRRKTATDILMQHGLAFTSTGWREQVTIAELEALAVVVGHVRESATPLALDGGPDLLEGVCACGVTYTVMPGPGEGDRLDRRHAEHVESVAERVKNFGLAILGA